MNDLVKADAVSRRFSLDHSDVRALDWVKQAHISFAGKVSVSLKDERGTQLPVARDRVRSLRSRLEF